MTFRSGERRSPASRRRGHWRFLRLYVVIGLAVLVSQSGCGGDKLASTPGSTKNAGVANKQDHPPVLVIPRAKHATQPRQAKRRPVQWRLAGSPSGRRIRVSSELGYCVGERPPRYEAVRVSERGDKVFITTYVGEGKASGRAICRGIGHSQMGIVVLSRDASSAHLYDASVSPPALRWPSKE